MVEISDEVVGSNCPKKWLLIVYPKAMFNPINKLPFSLG